MKKYEKEVQQAFLNNEEAVIKELKKTYDQSLIDISSKVKKLDLNIGYIQKALLEIEDDDIGDLARILLGKKKHLTPEEAKETLKSMLQSKVYQKNYQTALKKQVSGILDKMHQKEFTAVSDYLVECYDNGFMGAMYSLQNQGIPMCFPIDQTAMVRAVQLDSKISKGLYSRLGEDVAVLKKKIVAQVSRGISTGMSYQEIAKQLSGYTNIGFNNAVRIARTEGHRVQVQSAMNASYSAKEKGADVVKQWDAALDSSTRESHAKVDGEIRELDKPFSNGLMFPGDPSGGAAEVINCRCALLQRARWALDDDELETLKERAKYFGLDKTENFEEYKKKYLKVNSSLTNKDAESDKITSKKFIPAKTIEEAKEYAKNVFGLDCINYGDINLDVANAVNKEIQAVYNIFGDLRKSGELTGIRVLSKKQSYVAAYSPPMKEIFFTKNNVGYKSSLSKMAKMAKEQKGYGFWSTDAAEQSIRHELGHAIQHMITDAKAGNPFGNSAAKLNKISVLRQQVMKDCGITQWSKSDTEHFKPAGNILSYYGLKNDGEFIAESVAEYLGGSPREIARKVVEILLEGM